MSRQIPHFSTAMHLSTFHITELGILTLTAFHHRIACYQENKQILPPGSIIGQQKIHWYEQGSSDTTIVIDSSLGGVEGYLLIHKLANCGRVIMFDRPGYGWSPSSWQPRTSQQINTELQALLQTANIQPPYILIGDSFGSYNMRLFAHSYPEQVAGLIMTDGLHEEQMLSLPFRLQLLKLFFAISFLFVSIGALLGVVRIVGMLGVFEIIKPELKLCNLDRLRQVKRSFYRSTHWLTMAREMIGLDTSGRQLQVANDLGSLPVVNIKAATFLRIPGPASLWGWLMNPADRARDQIHIALSKVSIDSQQLPAPHSSHFVWVDQPEIMVAAVELVIDRINSMPKNA
jgi:pimeloyl-ACP methyl ester carboxylesterase